MGCLKRVFHSTAKAERPVSVLKTDLFARINYFAVNSIVTLWADNGVKWGIEVGAPFGRHSQIPYTSSRSGLDVSFRPTTRRAASWVASAYSQGSEC
jgi:hypothetical protein